MLIDGNWKKAIKSFMKKMELHRRDFKDHKLEKLYFVAYRYLVLPYELEKSSL